jgi:hypothetical protein
MAFGLAALDLTPLRRKERLLLLRATDAVRLCRGGGFAELLHHQAEAYLTMAGRRDLALVRDFIQRAHLASFPVSRFGDLQLVALLRKLAKGGDLVVVRESAETAQSGVPSLVQQRRIVRAIESKLRRPLNHEGRRYRLVAAEDLARLPDRDHYEVVSQSVAVRVLEALIRQADPALVALLAEARALLTRDWRPPFFPDGLVMLRRSAQVVAPVTHNEPPLTPSQLQKLMSPDWGVAPGAEHEDGFELATSAELEEPFELETGVEVESPPEEPDGAGDGEAAA